MNPQHPRRLLRELEQRARKRFGQHFLADPGLVRRIVRGARVQPGDRVIEIGPGLGILTEALMEAGAEVTAIELDRDLAAFLRERHPGLRLVEADATRVDWEAVAPGTGWKVVANLPYNVGTTLTMNLLRQPHRFSSVTVMLQLEVIERLMAVPDTRAYNALSVEAQARAVPVFLTTVEPGAFHPPPKVRSAVVRLELLPEPDTGGVPPDAFDKAVRAAFHHRRKTLANSLSSVYGRDRAQAALEAAGIDPGLRAQALDLDGMRVLARALHQEER